MSEKEKNLYANKGEIVVDLDKEFAKLIGKLSNFGSIVSTILNNDLVDDFTEFTDTIINKILSSYLRDDTTWNSIAAELIKYNPYTKYFLSNMNLNLLKSGIEDKIYYDLLKQKYSDLDFFIQQFWSKLDIEKLKNKIDSNTNFDELGISNNVFDIENYKNISNKSEYKNILELLKDRKEEFKKQLKEFLKRNKKNPKNSPSYQIFRYIFLKSKEFRSEVLDNILKIEKSDLKDKYKYYKKILVSYNNKLLILGKNPLRIDIESKLKNELFKLKEKCLNSNLYFDLENLKEEIKNKYKDSIEDKQFRAFVLKYFLDDVFKISFFSNNINELIENNYSIEEYSELAVRINEKDFLNDIKEIEKSDEKNKNLEQKKQTLELYKTLFNIKNIILQVEEKNFYAPWLKVFIKQGLAEKINFSDEGLKRLKYVLYFVVAQNYSEYYYLKKFFDDTEKIYYKRNYGKMFLNTFSLIIALLVIYAFLKYFVDSKIYATLFFIIISMIFFASWYIKFFKLELSEYKIFGSTINSKLIFLGGSVIFLLLYIFSIGYAGHNIFALISLFFFITFFFNFIMSFKFFKEFNSGIYNITKFLFLLMLLIGLSHNENLSNSFIEKGKQIIQPILGENIASDLFKVGDKSNIGKNNVIYTLFIKRDENSDYFKTYTDILGK